MYPSGRRVSKGRRLDKGRDKSGACADGRLGKINLSPFSCEDKGARLEPKPAQENKSVSFLSPFY